MKNQLNNAYSQSWKVTGLNCPDCVNKLQIALENSVEIQSVNIGFATQKLQVIYTDGVPRSSGAFTVSKVTSSLGFGLEPDTCKGRKNKSVSDKIAGSVYWSGIIIFVTIAIISLNKNPIDSQIFFSIATLWGLFPVIKTSWKQARHGVYFGIGTLMATACVGALILGSYREAAMVLILFQLGKYLEGYAADKSRKSVESLMALAPEKALLIENGETKEVLAKTLKPNDIIELLPGDRLPVDGQLLEATSLDLSIITGESFPVEKNIGEAVMAGTLVVDSRTRVKVTSEFGNNAINRILHLIEEADSYKAPIERLIDRFSARYTPIMMGIAVITALFPPLFFGEPWSIWTYKALTLLLISCPCALVISTPVAITSALATAARVGGLIKGGATLEKLASVKIIAFDKTGTLTKGKISVSDQYSVSDKKHWFAMAAAIEKGSSHPLAKAIVKEAQTKKLVIPEAKYVKTIAGKGVVGSVANQQVVVTSPVHLEKKLANHAEYKLLHNWITSQESKGKTVVGVCIDEVLAGLISLTDMLREDAFDALQALKKAGIDSIMLTGDNHRSAANIATRLGINYRAQLLPENKVEELIKLKQRGNVVMVGDGINDAPALKAADIGVAMGKGSDVALNISGVALTQEKLINLSELIRISQRTHRIIIQNISWALITKLAVLVTTLLGMTGLMVAVIAGEGVASIVIINSLRLLKKDRKIER